jgi:hypothetical protein
MPMWSWFRGLAKRAAPICETKTVGEIEVTSGELAISDLASPLFVSQMTYPNGDARVARIVIPFGMEAGPLKTQAEIGIDSATVILCDAQVLDSEWKEVGVERIGRTSTPGHHRRVAELIRERFGFEYRLEPPFYAVFQAPISPTLEEEITRYLVTFPEYAEYPFMYFRVDTKNSQERIQDAMKDRQWAKVALNKSSQSPVWAMETGFGDGTYPIRVLEHRGTIRRIEIEFIDEP